MIEKLEPVFEKCSDGVGRQFPPRPYDMMGKINELVEAVNRMEKQIEKQKEQKPAEWSEEDKDYYDAIIAKLKVTQDDAMLTDNQIDFLKSLPEKFILQPKQEWSEEDEKLLNKVETYLDDYCDFLEDESSRFIPEVRETISRLKSLRPSKDCSGCAKHLEGYISGRGDAENKLLEQFGALVTPEDELHIKPRWKPSEEQLNYVNWAYSIAVAENNTKAIEVLGELHDTLLNLI